MKIVADAEELEALEGLSDAELVKLVRDGFSKFRRGRDKEDPEAEDEPDVGGLRHGAPSNATLETGASRTANRNPGASDSAQRLRELGLSESRIQEILSQPSNVSDADRTAADKLIPNLRRL